MLHDLEIVMMRLDSHQAIFEPVARAGPIAGKLHPLANQLPGLIDRSRPCGCSSGRKTL